MNEIEQLSPEQLINTIFNPLSELDKSLPERVTQYILHSDEIDVLADFDKLCQNSANVDKIYDLLRGPYGRFSSWDECELKTNASIQGRIDFYKLWTDAYTPEQIIRYARFSAILFDHSSQIKRISEQIPSWLRYLLYDGLITTLLSYSENKDKIEGRENWSIQQLHQFLEIEQAGLGEKLLFAIFERQNIFEDYLPDFQYFTRLNGLLTYIQERIDLFKRLPSLGLAPLGQVEQLNFIQRYPQLQLQLVDFLIMQTLNTYKQVSQSATAILFSLPLDIVQPQLQHFLTSGSVKLRTNAAILLSRIISEPTILQQALTNETNKPVIAALESALLKLEIANVAKQQAHLVIPDFEPIIDTPLPITARDVIQQNFDEFLIKCKKSLQKAIEENKENIRSWEEYCKKLQTLTSNSLDDIFDYVNGKINLSALFKKLDNKIGFYFLLINNRLLNIPEFSLFHLFRIRGLIHNQNYTNFFEKIYENYDVIKKFELRQITDVLKKINIIPNVEYTIALKFLTNDYY
ncbi:hypothetical protein, partial [Gilliamella apicola]